MARKRTDQEPWEAVVDELFQDASAQELFTMATTYFQYYVACRQAGFNDAQAMQMVIAMQAEFLRNAYAAQKGDQDG